MTSEDERKPKLIRGMNHSLWQKTVKRARRVDGLEVHQLIEKLFIDYNTELDKRNPLTEEDDGSVIVFTE